tara:strand:- start:319 stop:1347 length:1029 start_codon:yes stop_codon:yes gene_type:complete
MEEFDEILIGDNFFDEEETEPVVEEVEKETKETKEISDDDFFDFEDEEDVSKVEESIVEKEEEPEKVVNPFYSKLNKLGYLEDLQDEEGNPIDISTLTEEEEGDLLEEILEIKTQESLNKMIKGLPNELRQLNEYVIKNGGSLKEFMSSMREDEIDYLKSDTLPEDKARSFLKKDLIAAGYEDDEIEIQLKALEDNGKLTGVANKRFDKWKVKQSKVHESKAKESKAANEERKVATQKFHTEVRSVLDSKNLGGLKLSSKVAKELDEYITKPIPDDSGRSMPRVHRDVLAAFEDPKKLAILAALAKEDFDISKLSKQFVTKGKETITKKINRRKIVPIRELF